MEEHEEVIRDLSQTFLENYAEENELLPFEISEELKNFFVYKDLEILLGEVSIYFLHGDKIILVQDKDLLVDLLTRIENSIQANNSRKNWMMLLELVNGLLYVFNNDFEMFYEDIKLETQLTVYDILKKL